MSSPTEYQTSPWKEVQYEVLVEEVEIVPHRALAIPDIVWEIASNLAEDDNADGRKRDLYAAARTCKAFESPCLDVLWSRMDTIVPLIRLLPVSERNKGFIVIRGAVNRESCPRFYHYARRVQHLDFTPTTMSEFNEIPNSTCIRLTQIVDAILPSLRTLRVDFGETTASQREKSIMLLSAFTRSPALKSFVFTASRYEEMVDEDYNVGAMLTALVDLNANIQNLEITGRLSLDHAQSLTSLKDVQSLGLSLSVGSWTHNLLNMISPFRALKNLSLDLGSALLFPSLPRTTDTFASVKKLSLNGRFPLVLQVLEMFPTDKLESITLKQATYGLFGFSISHNRRHYESVGRFSSLKTLLIDWRGGEFGGACDKGSAEDMVSILHPLWASPALESLTLKSIPLSLVFSDPTVAVISAAVPRVKVLHLEQAIRPRSTLPTFESLAQLAIKCPKLVKLSLTLQGAHVWLPESGRVSCHGLQELHLLNTAITRYTQASSAIDRLFPNLRTIDIFDPVANHRINDVIFDACRPARKEQQKREVLACGRLHTVTAGH